MFLAKYVLSGARQVPVFMVDEIAHFSGEQRKEGRERLRIRRELE
jgi:hypothetical protein